MRNYLKVHPKAAVINLGCGLENTGRICDNGHCCIWNIDLPEVIEIRDRLLPAGEREKNLAFDLKNPSWMEAVCTDPAEGAVLFASGVFYYFTTEAVKSLTIDIAKRFPGGRLVFDAAGQATVRLMLKTWVKQAGIQDVGVYFSVKNAKQELEPWSQLFWFPVGAICWAINRFMLQRFGLSTDCWQRWPMNSCTYRSSG